MEFKWYDVVSIVALVVTLLAAIGMWLDKTPTHWIFPFMILVFIWDTVMQVRYRTKVLRFVREILSSQVEAYEERLAGYNK